MTCLHCEATTSNGLALCARCLRTLSIALTNVSSYYADLARIRPGERIKARSTYRSTPPSDASSRIDRIAEELDYVRSHLVGWCLALLDDRPELGRLPKDPPSDYGKLWNLTAWLEAHLTTVATLEWAGELMRTTLNAEKSLRRLIERSDTGWYAGRCGNVLHEAAPHTGETCGCECHHGGVCDVDGDDGHGCHPEDDLPQMTCERPLYATAGVSWITCAECGASYNVTDRRERMIAEARDELAPVRVIAKVAVGLTDETSEERLRRRIEQWIRREQLASRGVKVFERRPRKVYRIGDVLDLLGRGA